jgi:penicillin-binding protein 2
MYLRGDERPPPVTPQFALRIAVMGGIALIGFSVIFFRLWYLEVLSGDRYLEAARNNQVREVRVPAPRGEVLDRNGEVLVDNRTSLALQLQADVLPKAKAARAQMIGRLSRVAGISRRRIEREIRVQTKVLPHSPVTLRQSVPDQVVYYLQENQRRFPGVSVERVFVRRYLKGTLAAHLFGNVGEVSGDQLGEPRFRRIQQGDVVGQSGIEYTYDRYLRGRPGTSRIQVDSLGRPKGELNSTPATPGRNLRLTIDSDLQAVGEQAMAAVGLPGGFVALDVKTGEVLALGSYPTFNPSVFSRRLSKAEYEALTSADNGAPLANRAIQGLYPTGSTFKAITAIAALDGGLIEPDTPVYDSGKLKIDTITFRNAGRAAYGTLTLRDALRVSSDVYFYLLGQRAPYDGEEQLIQKWAQDLGMGRRTGIDLPAEVDGLIPTPQWRNRLFRRGETDRPWTVGDNVNLSVGQGDLQSDPLQLALAYAAIANGGEVVRPHLGYRIEDPGGRVELEIRPSPRRKLDIDPAHRQAVMEGLRAAAMEYTGTSYKVFGGFPVDVAGKTGTAERFPNKDQAWYVAIAPYESPRIVVAVTFEQGGFGVDSAAPAAARIVSEYLNISPEDIKKVSAPPRPGQEAVFE